jgi:hypothetical protein
MAIRELASRTLHLGGLVVSIGSIGFLSSLPQSAAQMYLWPWCVLFVLSSVGAWVSLFGRTISRVQPFRMPGMLWTATAAASSR